MEDIAGKTQTGHFQEVESLGNLLISQCGEESRGVFIMCV